MQRPRASVSMISRQMPFSYLTLSSLVKRTGQQLFSTTNVKIDTYCTVFVKFKEEFYGRVAVQTLNTVNKTEIVVTHILDDVEDLGPSNTPMDDFRMKLTVHHSHRHQLGRHAVCE